MMRRNARSENSKIVRKLRSAPAPDGSGSRAFPLRAATSASMPALRSRRQSTVVVAKAVGKAGGSDVGRVAPRAKAVRSGKKPLVFSEPHGKPVDGEDEWARVFRGSGADGMDVDVGYCASDGWNGPSTPETDAAGIAPLEDDSIESDRPNDSFTSNKRFGMVYSRKRLQRELSHDAESVFSAAPVVGDLLSDQRFVNIYTRRKKLKVSPLSEVKYLHQSKLELDGKQRRQVMIPDSSWNLAKCVGISEDDLLTSLVGRMVLVVLVDSPRIKSSKPMSCILSFVRSWMNRGRFGLWKLAAHLLSGSLNSVSPDHGVHLLPLRWPNNLVLSRNCQYSYGLCKIYGARQSEPLLCLDFLALPSYFKWMHTSMLLGSLYLPCTLSSYLRCLCSSLYATVKSKTDGFQVFVEKSLASESSVKRKQPQDVVIALESVVRDGKILSGSKLRQLRRKRSSSRRQTRSWYPSLPSPHDGGVNLLSSRGNAGIVLESKMIILPDLLVEPLRLEMPESSDDFISYKDESDASTPVGSHEKCRKLVKKSPVDPAKEKEFRVAMAEVKQNILSACCKANVLVTVADRCWREEGYEVSLDVSTSQGWCIAVKSQGTLRYLHKPQDTKPCVVNRFTHAYMWQGEDGWKLEFLDRWDWSVFKELHLECRDHNIPEVPSRAIPVPGVHEVSGYEDYTTTSFLRPDAYIRMPLDEVHRSLVSENLYDMDSADEDWLKKFNSIHVMDNGGSSITEEEFEKTIYMFEKCAYNNLKDIFDKESVLELYKDFGNADALLSIYDYWIKKRTKRHAALMRVFQGPPLQKPLVHNTHLRKKRSFKRQRSQSSRTKHEAATEDIAESQKALQRIQDAESAAKRATETAIQLRNRAQMIMKHAELAAYKSVMALRIAEALQASESPNVASILD